MKAEFSHLGASLQDVPASDDDAVLLVKEWVSSPDLSQAPLCILPAAFLSRLDDVPLKVHKRNALPARAREELPRSS